MIDYLIFGPEKYIRNVDTPIRGSRGAAQTEDENMRRRLRVAEYLPSEIPGPDGSFSREELGKESFSPEARTELRREFLEGWGDAIQVLLADVAPYASHYACLEESREEWEETDQGGPDALAREAIFGGGNLYWTLRKSALDWRDDPNAQEIRQAWAQVEDRGRIFREKRSMALLQRIDHNSVVLTESTYQVLSTIACQLGLALTLATLAQRGGVEGPDLPRLARVVSSAINSGLGSRTGGLPRVFCFSQKLETPLNRISEMNTPRGVEFRYFWLEILCLAESIEVLEAEGSIDVATLKDLRDSARTHYFAYIVEESVKRAVRYVDDADRSKVEIVTSARTFNSLSDPLARWFDVSRDELDKWAAASDSLPSINVDEVEEFESEADETAS